MQIFWFVIFACLFISCSSPQADQPDLSAVPHAAALPTTELSMEDKAKLLEAAGKTVTEISELDLQNMFMVSDEQLYIYAFWNKKCTSCLESIKHLNALYSKMDADKIRIITINPDDNIRVANLTTRSQNIPFETYKLNASNKAWFKLIDENWNGILPAIFMVNKSEDLFLKYYVPMDQNQLEAIIQTLII